MYCTFCHLYFSANAQTYPDLPVGIKGGTGALIGDTVYVGLGSGGDKFYTLDLKDPSAQWKEIATFPGGERNQPVAAAVDGKLYVFGGLQKMKKANFNSLMTLIAITQAIILG